LFPCHPDEEERRSQRLHCSSVDPARGAPVEGQGEAVLRGIPVSCGVWDRERRVIAKIEWHPGELFPCVGFIVTNLPMEPDWVVRFYSQRGTAEQQIKEGKYAFRWTRLSCRRFRDNEVRLQLHALAYNLATFLRCIELPEAMADWSLTSLQLKLIHCLASDACITEREDRGAYRASCPCHHVPTG
jgi:hypothetical protein